jgi:hypothetical protein
MRVAVLIARQFRLAAFDCKGEGIIDLVSLVENVGKALLNRELPEMSNFLQALCPCPYSCRREVQQQSVGVCPSSRIPVVMLRGSGYYFHFLF